MKSTRVLSIVSFLAILFLYACSGSAPDAAPVNESNGQPPATVEPTVVPREIVPMFRGGLDHVGVYDVPPIHKLQGVKWKFNAEAPITTSPALANGLIYFGSQNGNLYALNSDDGVEVWSFHTEKPINSSPAVSNGTVYFQGNDGFTYALDAQSGAQKWKTETGPDRPTDYDNLSSSPAVQDGIVFIAGGNGNLYALDANTGEALWTVPALGYNSLRSSPAVVGDTVYFTAEKSLLALDTKAGRQKWEYKFITVTRSSPSVGDGVIVFGDNGSTIYAVDLETGAEKWKYRTAYYWVTSTAAISDGVVYIGSDDSYLNALDANTGEVKWRFKTTGETVWSSPAVVGNVIYVGDWNFSNIKDEAGSNKWGYMHAVDAKTGTELWSFKTGGNIVSSPVVGTDGVLYFGSLDGYMYALR